MRMWFRVAMCAALLGLAALPSPVVAQQKTVKACQDEWRANKADNQAKGITEKAYVAQCRAGSSAQPTSAPAATPAPTSSAATTAPKKTVKACQDEWRANKPAYQAAKITEKAYVDKCRAGESVALPTAPTATPAPAPTTAAPPPTSAAKPSPTPATPPAGAGQFQSEVQAKSQCQTDLVVWVNLTSKIYHFAGNKNYGTTKAGAYMCEKEATAQGFRASKTEKRPSAGS
jgi:septal ring-binding cell division protein DamX